MPTWRSLPACVPWLRKGLPYFVHASEETQLRECLQSAGFHVATMEGRGLTDERCVLDRLGEALRFPSYYGVNWDAFIDCIGEIAEQQDGPLALIWTDADVLLGRDLRAFIRAVHLLLSVARDLGSSADPYQMEVFLVARQEAFRNLPSGSA